MENQKLENLLNLAVETPEQEREKSLNLNTGFDAENGTWDIIVRSQSDLTKLEGLDERIQVVSLFNQYAIITVPQELLDSVASLEEIEYVEKPKRLYFELERARRAACITQVQSLAPMLTGKGVLVAVLDSGIDYFHPDFRKEDGTTRIVKLWDQTISGNPPEGYRIGSEYSAEEINQAILSNNPALVPTQDSSSHGTHVAGIAAGNGRASAGRYKGAAPEADLIIVKLGVPRTNSFPRTTELMQAADYCIRQAIALNMPLAVNISFGNSYGSHEGNSLLETYLNSAADIWKTVISVGTGNEGSTAGHTSDRLSQGETKEVPFTVGSYETTVNLQIWKNYADYFIFRVQAPSGESVELYTRAGKQEFVIGRTRLLIYYGEPNPYSQSQEIYIDFLPVNSYVDSGIWSILLKGENVRYGIYDMWLPVSSAVNAETEFLYPQVYNTLTIPSTADKVISVGAYDANLRSYASFSGRGKEIAEYNGKPELVAPGVDIISTAVGGGYEARSGTSMAAPFVTGSAALLMEWGIVRGNDPYLYGEKVKAYLIRGAKQLPGFETPNPLTGWGALCVRDSL